MSRCCTQITLADRRRMHHLVAAKVPTNETARLRLLIKEPGISKIIEIPG